MLRKQINELYNAGLVAPVDVTLRLKTIDRTLELIYHKIKNCWEVWKVTIKGVTSNEDELLWQISLPTQGSDISVGVVDYLKQFDTTCGGLLSADDLRANWIKHCKQIFYEDRLLKFKRRMEVAESWKELIHDFAVQKTVVAKRTPPQKVREHGICVGVNTQTMKKVYAYKELSHG